MTDQIDEILRKFNNADRSNLLDALQEIQELNGYISEEAVSKVSNYFNLATAKIYGILTFYDQFRFSLCGKFHIKVCNGTACHLSQSSAVLKELEKHLKIKTGQTTRDGLFSIEQVSCLGSCGLASVISINNNFYTVIKPIDVKEILENIKPF